MYFHLWAFIFKQTNSYDVGSDKIMKPQIEFVFDFKLGGIRELYRNNIKIIVNNN